MFLPYEATDWRVKLAACIYENKMYVIGGISELRLNDTLINVAGMFLIRFNSSIPSSIIPERNNR